MHIISYSLRIVRHLQKPKKKFITLISRKKTEKPQIVVSADR